MEQATLQRSPRRRNAASNSTKHTHRFDRRFGAVLLEIGQVVDLAADELLLEVAVDDAGRCRREDAFPEPVSKRADASIVTGLNVHALT